MTAPRLHLLPAAGRTPAPLNVLGTPVLVKLLSDDTGGHASMFHITAPPLSGPPLHRHAREDEWFYVLEGRITAEVDGRRVELAPGDSVFLPRGTAHTYQNFTDAPARMLVMTTPGGFDRFFAECSAMNEGVAAPDLAAVAGLMNRHGMELLGPPLSR